MFKNWPIFLLTLLSVLSTNAQTNRKDSLLQLLPKASEDTSKVRLLLNLAAAVRNTSPIEARSYLDQVPALASRLHDDLGLLQYYTGYSSTYSIEGKYDSAVGSMQQALTVANRTKDSLQIGMTLFNLGNAYRDKGEYTKAIEYCLPGMAIMDRIGLKDKEADIADALQVLYEYMARHDTAITYGKKALALARASHDRFMQARCLINLAKSYQSKGQSRIARPLLEEAYAIGNALQEPRIIATALANLADITLSQHDYAATIKYEEKIIALYKQIGSIDGQATSLRGLATSYLQQGKFDKAREYALQSLAIDNANGYKGEKANILLTLSSIEYATGRRDKAFDLIKQCNDVLEAMVTDIVNKNSTDLEKKYDTEKKQYRISQLEAEKQVQQLEIRQKTITNYVLIAGAITLLILLALLYGNFRQKRKIQQQRIAELEIEKQLHITEAVLKGEEQERGRLARDLHDGLGGMLSSIRHGLNNLKDKHPLAQESAQALEQNMKKLDNSISEMRRLAHNMMPDNLVKFGLDAALRDFCKDIDSSGTLTVNYQSIGLDKIRFDQTKAITIYRIVQELLNNILKHALASTVIVQVVYDEEGMLSITVEDDGVGFDTSKLITATGLGWTSIRNRIRFLKGKWDVQSAPEQGTSVLIEIEK